MISAASPHITACIPYYGCGRYLRRAVEGLLGQTHRNLTVIVMNDGDPDSPWPFLRDIRDPRLVRFDLAGNHGPYFATDVVLSATTSPYLLIQDADDWSPPTRATRLLDRMRNEGSDLAISAQLHYSEDENVAKPIAFRWKASTMDPRAGPCYIVRSRLTPQFLYRLPHHGLFRCDSVRRVGGYYGGFRVSYDALLTNLILMTGRISHLRQPLYYHTVRPGSLTQSDETGMRSQYRRDTVNALSRVYQNCFRFYTDYLHGRIDSGRFLSSIRDCTTANIPRETALRLAAESGRLRAVLAHSKG
jgi:glycosyltransferase involved in cell wall biosynthesis